MSLLNKNEVEQILTGIGFSCDFVPSEGKIARNWKRMMENEEIDTSHIPSSESYAVIPDTGMMIVDCDMPKEPGVKSGMTIINELLRPEDTTIDDYPEPFKVKTPSGGMHLYYRVPEYLQGHLKNAAHPQGIPIDIRCERKGYVIGACSQTEKGMYLPQLNHVEEALAGAYACPYLPDCFAAFFIGNGYTDIGMTTSVTERSGRRSGHRMHRAVGQSFPNLSAIPEGQRNDELYRWVFGRLMHYPENTEQIIRELYERGYASGLDDTELKTIADSAMRGVVNG
jgi:hypothetical protein